MTTDSVLGSGNMRPLWIQDTCFFQMACKPGTRTGRDATDWADYRRLNPNGRRTVMTDNGLTIEPAARASRSGSHRKR
jgi:hypothetical protein